MDLLKQKHKAIVVRGCQLRGRRSLAKLKVIAALYSIKPAYKLGKKEICYLLLEGKKGRSPTSISTRNYLFTANHSLRYKFKGGSHASIRHK